MKKLLPLLLLASLLFTACLSEENTDTSSPIEEGSQEEMTTLETVTEGEFTFIHKTQEENYYVDILYKDQNIGQLFKEMPADGWDVYVFETSANYAYLALEPTGLGGYIPFGGTPELFRVNLEEPDFQTLIFSGRVTDIADDDSALVYFSDVLPQISVMDLSQALYPNGSNVRSFVPEESFNYAGDALFSPDGTELAYVALEGPDNERSRVYIVDLATGTQTEFLTQVGRVVLTGWTGTGPSYE